MLRLTKNRAVIHRRQSGLAWAAVLAATPGLIFGSGTGLAGLFIMTFAPLTVPLFVRRDPRGFSRFCTVIGLGLVVWSVVGVMLGMFLFLPAAVLLMLAAGAGPQRSPGVARVLSAAGGLVLAGVVLGSAMWCWRFYVSPALTKPHTYRAVIDVAWSTRVDLGEVTERLKPFGASDVTISQFGGANKAYLEVGFPDSLSDMQRATLEEQISELPGVGRVALCPVRDCG